MRIAVLDIGGTSIKSGLWDGTQLSDVKETATMAQEGGAAVAARAADILRGYGCLDAIGISTAGQVNTTEGSIHYANPNIPGYTGTPLKTVMEQKFQVPTAVENDVNAAALGELYFGAARGEESFLCLTYGTGVGGAIVINREVFHGANWSGGYFGGILVHPEARHWSVWGSGEQSAKEQEPGANSAKEQGLDVDFAKKRWPDANICGAKEESSQIPRVEELSGCYERYASATALVRAAQEVDASLTDGRRVFAAFERPEVRKVIDAWIDETVWGLITLIHIFDPPMVVLGGGIFAQPYVSREVKRRVRDRIDPGFTKVRIETALLGNSAGMIGAAALAQKLI
ncbi:MAG: ROK family protein [Lachnospiraceae bacterium]|nr:ROK family protein [Lachnospiraceae bacterium]